MEKAEKNLDGNVLEHTFSPLDEAVDKAKSKGNEYLKKIVDKGQSIWSGAQSTQRQTWGRTKEYIQKHPAQAVGYAALLGAVLAILLLRKKED